MKPSCAADVHSLLREGECRLTAASDTPHLDANVLLAHVLDVARSWLLAHPEHCPDAAAAARYRRQLTRRGRGEPLAYLVGQREFWSLELAVTPAVLVPRPDTECLVEQALARIPAGRPIIVADLGTGSGAVALAIARERPAARIIATDASHDALAVARDNANRLALTNVTFELGDWFKPLEELRAACIVSNPPYVAEDDPHLTNAELSFEPRHALVADDGGLAALHHIIDHAPAHLMAGGWLLLEHGCEQRAAVASRMRQAGFVGLASYTDLGGRDRVTAGRWTNG